MPDTGAKPIVVAVAGGIFLYSGFKGLSLTTTLRDLLTGRNPSKDVPTDTGLPVDAPDSSIHLGAAQKARTQTAAQNQAIAKPLARLYGWTEKNGEWQALVTLWNNESGWSNTAYNKSSGATGIPQAVPGNKLPPAGQAPTFDARAQIAWGLTYIKGRYGKPSVALTFWNRTDPRPYPGHWY